MFLFNIYQHIIFALYDIRQDLVAFKILSRGVAVICPPGKHHSDSFPKSVKICQHREDAFYQPGRGLVIVDEYMWGHI